MSNDDDMNPDMTPEEEEAAVDAHRERLKQLDELPPPTDPGQIRERNRQREELHRRVKEYEDRKKDSED